MHKIQKNKNTKAKNWHSYSVAFSPEKARSKS